MTATLSPAFRRMLRPLLPFLALSLLPAIAHAAVNLISSTRSVSANGIFDGADYPGPVNLGAASGSDASASLTSQLTNAGFEGTFLLMSGSNPQYTGYVSSAYMGMTFEVDVPTPWSLFGHDLYGAPHFFRLSGPSSGTVYEYWGDWSWASHDGTTGTPPGGILAPGTYTASLQLELDSVGIPITVQIFGTLGFALVPEPSAAWLAVTAATPLLLRRRRH